MFSALSALADRVFTPEIPSEPSIMRLIGAALFEQSDEWRTASRCMMIETVAQIDREEIAHPSSASQRKPPDHAIRPAGKLHRCDGCEPVAATGEPTSGLQQGKCVGMARVDGRRLDLAAQEVASQQCVEGIGRFELAH